jgi:hypothetical protein
MMELGILVQPEGPLGEVLVGRPFGGELGIVVGAGERVVADQALHRGHLLADAVPEEVGLLSRRVESEDHPISGIGAIVQPMVTAVMAAMATLAPRRLVIALLMLIAPNDAHFFCESVAPRHDVAGTSFVATVLSVGRLDQVEVTDAGGGHAGECPAADVLGIDGDIPDHRSVTRCRKHNRPDGRTGSQAGWAAT